MAIFQSLAFLAFASHLKTMFTDPVCPITVLFFKDVTSLMEPLWQTIVLENYMHFNHLLTRFLYYFFGSLILSVKKLIIQVSHYETRHIFYLNRLLFSISWEISKVYIFPINSWNCIWFMHSNIQQGYDQYIIKI